MSPAMTNAAITMTGEVEYLLGAISDILDKENEAVQSSNFVAFKELQNDKFALLGRYRTLVDTLQRQMPQIKEADNTIIERLHKSAARFQESVKQNALVLNNGKQSIQRILDRIVGAARDAVHGDRKAYNSNGKTGNHDAVPVSIRVNETL